MGYELTEEEMFGDDREYWREEKLNHYKNTLRDIYEILSKMESNEEIEDMKDIIQECEREVARYD